VLPVILYGRLAAVLAFDEWQRGAATPLPRLHRVRIAAKRLRYTLEFFEEVLGPEAHALIDQMKRLQDHLGEIQDDVVAVTVLRDFLTWGTWRHREGVPTPRAPVLAPGVASYLAARQRDLAQRLEEFPSHWAEFSDGSFTRKLAAALAVLEYGDTHGQS
jgi:CHAD domain-containing protein